MPVYIHLAHWFDEEQDLLPFLQDQLTAQGVPELAHRLPELSRQGKLLLLLDGADEIPGLSWDWGAESPCILDRRLWELAKIGKLGLWRFARCVLTGRVRDFTDLPGWTDLRIIPPQPSELKAFVRTFYFPSPVIPKPDARAGFTSALSKTNKKSSFIPFLDWATRPFYLKLLWEFYQSQNTTPNASGSNPPGQADLGAGGEERTPTQITLPARPGQLLKTITNTRLELVAASYTTSQNLLPFEVAHLPQLLSKLAYTMNREGYPGWIELKRAAARLLGEVPRPKYPPIEPTASHEELDKAKTLFTLAEKAGFILVGEGRIKFSHPIWQTYFCALYCLAQPFKSEAFGYMNSEIALWPVWAFMVDLDEGLLNRLLEAVSKGSDPNLAFNLICGLGHSRDKRAVAPLANWLGHQGLNSTGADNALVWLGREAIPTLKELISHSEDENLAWQTLWRLGRLSEEEIEDFLIQLLSNPALRMTAIEGLGNLRVRRAIEPLGQLLDDAPNERCDVLTNTLTILGGPALVLLLETLSDRLRPEVQESVAYSLGILADPLALGQALLKQESQNQDGSWPAREEAKTLEERKQSDALALEALKKALESPNMLLRRVASEVLSRAGELEVVNHLIQALASPDRRTRLSAISHLGELGDERAVEPLIALLESYSQAGKAKAGKANQPWYSPQAMFEFARNLLGGHIPGVKDATFFEEGLKDLGGGPDEMLEREYIAMALGRLGDTRAVPVLITLLREGGDHIRHFASGALSGLEQAQPESVLKPILELLEDEDYRLRMWACSCLQGIRRSDITGVLGRALKDPHPEVRKRAAWVLEQTHDPASQEILIEALEDDSPEVRYPVIMALGHIGDEQALSTLENHMAKENGTTLTGSSLKGEIEKAIDAIRYRMS